VFGWRALRGFSGDASMSRPRLLGPDVPLLPLGVVNDLSAVDGVPFLRVSGVELFSADRPSPQEPDGAIVFGCRREVIVPCVRGRKPRELHTSCTQFSRYSFHRQIKATRYAPNRVQLRRGRHMHCVRFFRRGESGMSDRLLRFARRKSN
jgi:hypothetical protein